MTEQPRTLNLNDWPLPDPYLAAVGRITLLWERLQQLLSLANANLTGFGNLGDQRVDTVFSRGPFTERLALLEDLCAAILPAHPGLASYRGTADMLREADALRRQYLEGALAPSPADGRVEMAVDVNGKRQTREVSVAELAQAAIVIDAAQHALYKLVMAMSKPSATWHSD